MNPNVLEIKKLNKTYPSQPVLKNLDLAVPEGTVMGLLGKNGAGKTTLIKCALGLLRPESGSIILLGEPVWELSAKAKNRLGYVAQTNHFHVGRTVRAMISYTAPFYFHWNSFLIERLMREWDLPPDSLVAGLSVGQIQKLAMLLAVGHEPDVLVLDEPAASLDPVARRQFLKMVLDISANKKRTVLFSTHITSDLERVADHIAILKDGGIVYCGGLDEIKDRVKCLNIIASKPLPETFAVSGMLRRELNGNEALVSVQNVTPSLIKEIESQWSAKVEIQDLNLEDIFLEFHHE